MSIKDIPIELQNKMQNILDMDLDQLNDAYLDEMRRQGRVIMPADQPQLDEMYRVLIPELFELAKEQRRKKAN